MHFIYFDTDAITSKYRFVLNSVFIRKLVVFLFFSITCVQDRKRRSRFNLYIQPLVDVNTVEFQDHLFWIGASSAVQIIAFLLLLFVYISLENFATLISKQAGYHSIPDKDYESLAESENDS